MFLRNFFKKKLNIYSLIFIFIFILFLTDYILTKLYYSYLSRIPKSPHAGIQHPIFHHHLKSNISITEYHSKFGDQKIITNSLGFRDKEIRDIKYKTNNKRIIFIGDSFTYGYLTKNYEDTYVGLIEKFYDKNNQEKIEVLNAAVQSYSPIIYYNKIKYFLNLGLEFTHLVVFIDVGDIGDETFTYKWDEKNKKIYVDPWGGQKLSKKEKFLRFIQKNFYTFFHLSKLIIGEMHFSNNSYLKNWMKSNHKQKWTINSSTYRENTKGIERSLFYMQSLKKLCDQKKIKLTIAVYPGVTQVYNKDLNSLQVKLWKEFSETNKIQFINFFPQFIDQSDNEDTILEKIKIFFLPFDYHFSVYANKLIAKNFVNFFKF